ncbi:hypothetical protein [Halorussus pelagicus]|uniref:hypothetical protein n=1 Tax=Halorussus pelagicus TaxID=2505977 RepID=UPI000FFC664B|nr:hypothetical protein [Halorussus pelagicus]
MNWVKALATLAVLTVTFVAVGALVGLIAAVLDSVAALAVVVLLLAALLGASKAGASPNRLLSNPYWGR